MMRRLGFLFLIITLLLPFSSSAQDDNLLIIAPDELITLGVATDLSNIFPADGLDMLQSVQLAIFQFNAAGGVEGFEVNMEVQDDLCTPEGGAMTAQQFADEGYVVGVVGHLCSGASIPAAEIYEEARIPMVSPSSTAAALTASDFEVVNRTIFNDNQQGLVAARYIKEVLNVDRIAVLHNFTPYGQGLAAIVEATFEGEIVFSDGVLAEDGDFSDTAQAIAESQPDLVYFGGYDQEAVRLLEAMHEVGIGNLPFFSSDGIYTQDFLKAMPIDGGTVYATSGLGAGDPAENAIFDDLYEQTYGVRPEDLGFYHAEAYDAANMILLALQQVAVVDEEGNLVIDREALIAAVRGTHDFQGLSGVITCDDNGDCAGSVIVVYKAGADEWEQQEVPAELQSS